MLPPLRENLGEDKTLVNLVKMKLSHLCELLTNIDGILAANELSLDIIRQCIVTKSTSIFNQV